MGWVLQYYGLLRSVLRAKPRLRGCLTRCRHCRIFFITHPRNARRHDLRCPFGCREAHRKKASTQRSTAYYRDPQGRKKKSALNQRRRSGVPGSRTPGAPSSDPVARNDSVRCRPALVEHVRMVVSLLEGRPVSHRQVRALLAKVLRQHRIPRRRKIDHTVAWLNKGPPEPNRPWTRKSN